MSQAGDGVVALQSADPSCRDDGGAIYVDCGNGTVTDNRTGLVWFANADCLGDAVDWYTAMEVVAGLSDLPGSDPDDCGLSDGSSPGEWRLPSKTEWEAMVANAVALGCVGGFGGISITDDLGTGCWSSDCHTAGSCAFSDVDTGFYWASSSSVTFPAAAWNARLSVAEIFALHKLNNMRIWPVRGGQ